MEVTLTQYGLPRKKLTKYGVTSCTRPAKHRGEDHPVENVSWNDVQKFLSELNGQTAAFEAMLPSEAQWEYACRAGKAAPIAGTGKPGEMAA